MEDDTRFTPHEPTEDELATIRQFYADHDPEDPPWPSIQARLIRAGNSLDGLRDLAAPAIVAMLNGANRANLDKLFPKGVPEDPDIVDLVVRLNSEKGSGKTAIQIAREFKGETMGDDTKAKRLLARIRKMRGAGKVNI